MQPEGVLVVSLDELTAFLDIAGLRYVRRDFGPDPSTPQLAQSLVYFQGNETFEGQALDTFSCTVRGGDSVYPTILEVHSDTAIATVDGLELRLSRAILDAQATIALGKAITFAVDGGIGLRVTSELLINRVEELPLLFGIAVGVVQTLQGMIHEVILQGKRVPG
jgi:hypothetical protein